MTSTEKYWKEFDKFLPELMREDSVEISLTIEAEDNPRFRISIDGEILEDRVLEDGETTLTVVHHYVNQDQKTSIDFSMHGKINGDTVIDADGQIIRDKYIKIKELFINKFSLVADPDFFYGDNLDYLGEDGAPKSIVLGFWANDTLRISYDRPFSLWYNQRSSRNKKQIHTDSAKHDGPLVDELWHSVIKNVNKLEDH